MNIDETIVVMCNGRSVLNVDFDRLKNVATFGLNMAYKWYYKNNWWPTYHGAFDYLNNSVFSEQYKNMSYDDSCKIQRFFYVSKISNSNKVTHVNLNQNQRGWNDSENSFNNFYHFGNTGTNACSVAAALGYKNILLLGADNTQKENYDGVSRNSDGVYIMNHTPKENPCYWFNYYLEEGDVFNPPRIHLYHTPWWPLFAAMAAENNVRVINCSDTSHDKAISCFEVGEINNELDKIGA